MFCGNPNTGRPWYTPSLWAVQLASPNILVALIVEPSGPGQPYGNNLFQFYQQGAALSGHTRVTGHAQLVP